MKLNDVFRNVAAIGVPMLENYAYGGSGDPNAIVNDNIRGSYVNGSGPNDPRAAASQAPATLMDQIFGKQVARDGTVSFSYLPLLLIGGAIAVFFFWRK